MHTGSASRLGGNWSFGTSSRSFLSKIILIFFAKHVDSNIHICIMESSRKDSRKVREMKTYKQAIEYLADTYPHAFDREHKDYEDDRHDLNEAAWTVSFIWGVRFATVRRNTELCVLHNKAE